LRYPLLDMLKCPVCRQSEFRPVTFTGTNNEIEDGLLICSCGESYPVVSGVPRVLPLQLQGMVRKEYGGFFDRYADQIKLQRDSGPSSSSTNTGSGGESSQESLKERTAQGFGYQWNEFSTMLDYYKENFEHYFEGFPADFFKGKLVLDAGCGMGRHSYYAAVSGARVIGMDLSSAVDAAYHNNRVHENSHFLQGDVYNIPLKEESFDLVYSLGVMHYLPDPEEGFRQLLRFVKLGGRVHIYVYHKLEQRPVSHKLLLALVTQVRRITPKIPYPMLKRICLAWAAMFYLGLILPARVMKKIPGLGPLANRIPLHRYSDSPFSSIYKDTFDRFSPPLEHRFSRQEIVQLFRKHGLTDISALGGSGWRVSGTKPLEATEESRVAPRIPEPLQGSPSYS
jgi:SAM-dependent methyltransferase/uncharacterized protein YbaR (Trm112 family)